MSTIVARRVRIRTDQPTTQFWWCGCCLLVPPQTPSGKPFEAGTRGFWKDYPNIEHLVAELGLSERDVFTEFTASSFFSPDGLEATAPVFGDSLELPSPLGQVRSVGRLASTVNSQRTSPLLEPTTRGRFVGSVGG